MKIHLSSIEHIWKDLIYSKINVSLQRENMVWQRLLNVHQIQIFSLECEGVTRRQFSIQGPCFPAYPNPWSQSKWKVVPTERGQRRCGSTLFSLHSPPTSSSCIRRAANALGHWAAGEMSPGFWRQESQRTTRNTLGLLLKEDTHFSFYTAEIDIYFKKIQGKWNKQTKNSKRRW